MLDPVPRKLLTTNEYSEVGYKTTEIELKKMRKYCCSRECNQWELMKRLNHKEELELLQRVNLSKLLRVLFI